jgi:hypothetical protein
MGFFQKLFSETDLKEQRPTSGDPVTDSETDSKPEEGETPSGPWTGVDLDGTLAVWDAASSLERIGPPVTSMLSFVQRMVENGIRVKIFTARAGDPKQIPKIKKWLEKNGLPDLEITNVKDYSMERLYDDRAVQVEANTGRIISDIN